ncbi:MAG: hypothetical protein WCI27_02275, partial [Candidatus Omnitrophota bacterium]
MRKPPALYSRQDIEQLCARAVDPDETVSKPAVQHLFSDLVERMSDSFLFRQIVLYDRVFTQVIDYCRRLPAGDGLDSLLKRFMLLDENAILARKRKIQRVRRFPARAARQVRKICVLSRITVGADVAVTGVVLGRLTRIFPGVNIVLIGPQKLAEVFGGHPDIKIRDVPYARRGGLLGRLYAWVELVRVIDDERHDLRGEEFLVIDPDSRLTQLGLLPVVPDDQGYYFFPSRTYAKSRTGRMGELAANWMDDVFGKAKEKAYPEIFIHKDMRVLGQACIEKLSYNRSRPVISINFGVGGNNNKKVSADFEVKLLEAIWQRGAAILLDKGFGLEVDMMNALISRLKSKGISVLEVDQGNIVRLSQEQTWSCDVMTWEGGVGVFGALTACSSLYIGYDSG